jgi:hypothetical protein
MAVSAAEWLFQRPLHCTLIKAVMLARAGPRDFFLCGFSAWFFIVRNIAECASRRLDDNN